MRFTTVALAATAVVTVSAQDYVTGSLGDAPVTTGNSGSIVYAASIMSDLVHHATVNFTGTTNGTGVLVQACFMGINAGQPGPYPYHIHKARVPEDGNCTATLAHFDPYNRTAAPPCDKTMPKTCEIGDLSGKHGKVPVDLGMEEYCTSYIDPYISLVPGDKAFIGDAMRSVVIHNANATRIGCANLDLVSGTPNGNSTTPPSPQPTGAAGKIGSSGLFLGLAVAAAGALLL